MIYVCLPQNVDPNYICSDWDTEECIELT